MISRGVTWDELPAPLLAGLIGCRPAAVVETACWILVTLPDRLQPDAASIMVINLLSRFRGASAPGRMRRIQDWPAYLAEAGRNADHRHRRQAVPTGNARLRGDALALNHPDDPIRRAQARETLGRLPNVVPHLSPAERVAFFDLMDEVGLLRADNNHCRLSVFVQGMMWCGWCGGR